MQRNNSEYLINFKTLSSAFNEGIEIESLEILGWETNRGMFSLVGITIYTDFEQIEVKDIRRVRNVVNFKFNKIKITSKINRIILRPSI